MSSESTSRTAIVTGASRRQGIGAAIAVALVRDGFDVGLVHHDSADVLSGLRDPDGVVGVVADIRTRAPKKARVETIDVDLSHREAAEAVFDCIRSRLGSVSVLINNAAWSEPGRLEELLSLIHI